MASTPVVVTPSALACVGARAVQEVEPVGVVGGEHPLVPPTPPALMVADAAQHQRHRHGALFRQRVDVVAVRAACVP